MRPSVLHLGYKGAMLLARLLSIPVGFKALSDANYLTHELKHWHEVRLNTLRPRRNEQHFADDNFKRIFFNENVWIPIKISLKFVPKGPINNIPALVQIIAWRRSGDKPLFEPMMVSLPTHICVSQPQWVNYVVHPHRAQLTHWPLGNLNEIVDM